MGPKVERSGSEGRSLEREPGILVLDLVAPTEALNGNTQRFFGLNHLVLAGDLREQKCGQTSHSSERW